MTSHTQAGVKIVYCPIPVLIQVYPAVGRPTDRTKQMRAQDREAARKLGVSFPTSQTQAMIAGTPADRSFESTSFRRAGASCVDFLVGRAITPIVPA